MAIYFSERFKKNRKGRNLTQEQLADVFHVSPQAVSRWETGAAYPDIELLPSIAAYFNISVDELLGVDEIKNKERIDELFETMFEKWNSGHMDDAITLLKNAVREFPNEYQFQIALALSIQQKEEPDKDKQNENLREAISIREHILEHCTDDATRSHALFGLAGAYKKAGDMEKAVKTAKKLTDVDSSSNVVLMEIYEGDELFAHLKKNICVFSRNLAYSLQYLAKSKYKIGSDEGIQLMKLAISVYEMIYTNQDYGFNHYFLTWDYYQLANHYHTKDDAHTLACLEKAAHHAVAYDNHACLTHHTSLAVENAENDQKLVKNQRCNEAHTLLESLADGIYFTTLQENEQYKAIIAKLRESAEKY